MYWEALSSITSAVGNSSFLFCGCLNGENSKYTINCIHTIKLKDQLLRGDIAATHVIILGSYC
jgi:hypothetical protein